MYWDEEFGKEYNVPGNILDLVMYENILDDTSSDTEPSPSFHIRGSRYTLWVEHPIKAKRSERHLDRYFIANEKGDIEFSTNKLDRAITMVWYIVQKHVMGA